MRKQLNLFLVLLLTGTVYGCGSGSSSTNTAKSTSQTLDNTLNNFLQLHGESEYFSAISATVQCNNRPPVYGIAGTYQLNVTIPINTNSLFQIGSISKSFTSVVLLQLVDDPKNNLSLQDTMAKWFPEYPQWANVTIEQLLNMSSGIPDYINDTPVLAIKALVNPTYDFKPAELVAVAESMPVFFAPGNGYHYSNTDYVLLGMLIQKITGNSPITEIQKRIINKLGLTHTYFPPNLPASIAPIFAMVNGYAYYTGLPNPYAYIDGLHDTTWSSMSIYYTAGGIISTPDDINTYVHALYHPGLILNEGEFTSLTTDMVLEESSVDFPNGGQPITQVSESFIQGYGLGIQSTYNTAPAGVFYNYTGATLGYTFFYAYFPTINAYVLFTINNGQIAGTDLYYQVFDTLLKYTYTNECRESSVGLQSKYDISKTMMIPRVIGNLR